MATRLPSATLASLVILLVCCWVVQLSAGTIHADGAGKTHRIVAIGDIHGDPEKLKRLLAVSNVAHVSSDGDGIPTVRLIDHSAGSTSPQQTSVIQMGDLVDRGGDDRQALNIAFELFDAARNNKTAYNVVLLLGNHELMNLQKNYHYVNEEDFGGFLNKRLRDMAFDTEGPYGKFIIDNFKTVHIEAGTVFVHAGITPDYLVDLQSVDDFNEEVRSQLRSRNYRGKLLNSRSPIWTRQTVFDSMAGRCSELEKVLSALQVHRMIVGHTPERSGHIGEYCEGRLFTIDVGLSRWMYNNFAALEIVVREREDKDSGAPVSETTLWELDATSRRRVWPPADAKLEDSSDFEDL